MLRKLLPNVVERLAPAGVRHLAAAAAGGGGAIEAEAELLVSEPTVGEVSCVPPLEKRKLGKEAFPEEEATHRHTRARAEQQRGKGALRRSTRDRSVQS